MSLSLRENGCEYREDLWMGAVWMNGVSGQRSKKGSVANIVGTTSDQNEVGAMRQSVISENSLSAQVPKLGAVNWNGAFRFGEIPTSWNVAHPQKMSLLRSAKFAHLSNCLAARFSPLLAREIT